MLSADKKFRICVLVIALLGAFAIPAAAKAATGPEAFFEGAQKRLVAIARTAEGGRRSACNALILDVFDARALARKVASAAHWSIMRPDTREELTRAVAGRLGRECLALVERADPALARIGRTRMAEGGARVTVLMPDERGTERVIVWSLRTGGRFGWTATDLSLDGRSASATYHQDFENALAARSTINDAVAYFAVLGAR